MDFAGARRGAFSAFNQKTASHRSNSTPNVQKPHLKPSAAASAGEPNAAIDCPKLPAPYTPSAAPCRCGGYQPLTKPAPTEKLASAMPMKKPQETNCQYSETNPIRIVGTIEHAITMANISSPPTPSVNIPTGIRPRPPSRTRT